MDSRVSKPVAEALEKGTDAVSRPTVEIGYFQRGYLVRYKNAAGYVKRKKFAAGESEEANAQFWRWVEELREESNGDLRKH